MTTKEFVCFECKTSIRSINIGPISLGKDGESLCHHTYKININYDGNIVCERCKNIKIHGLERIIYHTLNECIRNIEELEEYNLKEYEDDINKIADGITKLIDKVNKKVDVFGK